MIELPYKNKMFSLFFTINESTISIICEPKDKEEQILSDFTYSLELNYEELKSKGKKSFYICENIKEIFRYLKELLNNKKASLKSSNNDNNSIILVVDVPLILDKFESIELNFNKKIKDKDQHIEELKNYIRNRKI